MKERYLERLTSIDSSKIEVVDGEPHFKITTLEREIKKGDMYITKKCSEGEEHSLYIIYNRLFVYVGKLKNKGILITTCYNYEKHLKRKLDCECEPANIQELLEERLKRNEIQARAAGKAEPSAR
jgi:hypothetical protein